MSASDMPMPEGWVKIDASIKDLLVREIRREPHKWIDRPVFEDQFEYLVPRLLTFQIYPNLIRLGFEVNGIFYHRSLCAIYWPEHPSFYGKTHGPVDCAG